MKAFCALVLLVIMSSRCYAVQQSSTTSSPTMPNVTSGIEKEDVTSNKRPVRMMPLRMNQHDESNIQSDQPAGSSPENTRISSWNRQTSTPKPEQIRSGRQRMPSRNQFGAEGNPVEDRSQDASHSSGNPVGGFEYRATWQDDRQIPRRQYANREDEDSFLPPPPLPEARNTNPRYQHSRQPTGDFGVPRGPKRDDDDDEDTQYDAEGGNQVGSEHSRIPAAGLDRRILPEEGERGVRFQYNPSSLPAANFGGVRQPGSRQDPSLRQPVDSRSPFGDPIYAQPRETATSPDSDERRFPVGQGPRPGQDGTWTNYRTYGMGTRDDGVLYQSSPNEPHQHRPYSFNYLSESDEGTHGHQQTADESGRVIGSYSISLDDGRKRIVEYIADENGFRASIDSNEPGMAFNVNPANVVYYNTPGTAERRTAPAVPVTSTRGVVTRDQSRRQHGVSRQVPPMTSSRWPSYTSSQGVPAATRTQEDPELRARLPPNLPNELSDVPRYDAAQPMFPARRRLPDPRDPENSLLQGSPRGARGNAPTDTADERDEEEGNRQSRRLPSQPIDDSEGLDGLRYGESPRVPSTRMNRYPSPSQSRSNSPVNRRLPSQPAYGAEDTDRPNYDESPRSPSTRYPMPSQHDQQAIPSPSRATGYPDSQVNPIVGQPMDYGIGSPAENSFMDGSNRNDYESGNRFWFRRST